MKYNMQKYQCELQRFWALTNRLPKILIEVNIFTSKLEMQSTPFNNLHLLPRIVTATDPSSPVINSSQSCMGGVSNLSSSDLRQLDHHMEVCLKNTDAKDKKMLIVTTICNHCLLKYLKTKQNTEALTNYSSLALP